jgi:hypothetical protein
VCRFRKTAVKLAFSLWPYRDSVSSSPGREGLRWRFKHPRQNRIAGIVEGFGMANSINEPTKADFDAHTNEFQALRNGVSNATLAWAEVENAMVALLTAILNRENMGIPAAMYFALSGIESRLTMVSYAFTELLFEQEKTEYAPRLGSLWDKMIRRLKRLKTTRNQVAHGQIVSISDPQLSGGSPLGTQRLTSPAYDFSRFREARKEGRLPGLSAKEVLEHSKAVYAASQSVYDFEQCVRFIHADSVKALLEKLLQLEARGQRSGAPHSPTPKGASSQPPPSQGKRPKMSKRERRESLIKAAKASWGKRS